jgi:carbonic anhydrase
MKRIRCFGIVFLFLGLGAALVLPAVSAQHTAQAPSQATVSADAVWSNLVAGNSRFVADKLQPRALITLRQKLASGQSPKVIILSCSDSRVGPELIFDQSLGDIFVVRTAGNVADPVALGSIEYAVDHIHSPLLVVLGHQKCGAVSAACSGEKMPSPNLEAIVQKINPAVAQAKTYAKADDLVESAVKENVRQSAKDVLANSEIIRNAVNTGKLKVIEAEYELDTGKVVRLDAPAAAQN